MPIYGGFYGTFCNKSTSSDGGEVIIILHGIIDSLPNQIEYDDQKSFRMSTETFAT